MPGAQSVGSHRARGVALLLTIWVLALLAVLALGLTADVSAGMRITRNLVDGAQARALADAGFWQALAELLSDRPAAGIRFDGTPREMTVAGHGITVSIQDEAGKVDLNAAPEDQLARLLQAVGLERQAAGVLARNIGGYRTMAAAISRETQAANFPDADATGADTSSALPFLTPGELRLVPGVTQEYYTRILPAVTVYSGDWRINPISASPPVLFSLSAIDRPAIERFLALRRETEDAVSARLTAPPAMIHQAVWRSFPRVVTILSVAHLDSGSVWVREAVVDLAPPGGQLFKILSWTPS